VKPSRRLTIFANVILLAGCGLALLMLAYFVYHYAWTRSRVFTGALGPFLYLGIPAAVSALLFASIKLPPAARVRLSAVLSSTSIAVYGFGIVVTFWDQMPSVRERADLRRRRQIAAAQGLPFDGRTRAEVVHDLRAGGTDAVPAISVSRLLQRQRGGTLKSAISVDGAEVMPLSGIADKLTVLCNEGGTYVTFRSDEHGFNNPRNTWEPSVDILALGDSFVQGTCVEPDQNFVATIRRRRPATLNGGIRGNGPLIMLGTLKEYGRVIKPHIVLWFYFEGNDLAELSREKHSPLLREYLTGTFTQNLFRRQPEIDRALINEVEKLRRWGGIPALMDDLPYAAAMVFDRRNPIQALIKLSDLRNAFGLVGGRALSALDDTPPSLDAGRSDDRIDLLRRVVEEANATVAAWSGRLYFVYLPEWARFSIPERGGNQLRRAVLRAVRESGVPLIDVTDAFSARRDAVSLFSLRIGYHYNEEGARVVAETVLRAIDVVN
jgi:hypothetical protein